MLNYWSGPYRFLMDSVNSNQSGIWTRRAAYGLRTKRFAGLSSRLLTALCIPNLFPQALCWTRIWESASCIQVMNQSESDIQFTLKHLGKTYQQTRASFALPFFAGFLASVP